MPKYRQNPQTAWREIDKEAVIIEPSEGRLLVLNATGLFLWTLLESAVEVETLATALSRKFEISASQAQADVTAFLETLQSRKLVQCL